MQNTLSNQTCAVWELFNQRNKLKLKFANFVINGWYIDRKRFTSILSSEYNFERGVIVRFCALFWRIRLPKCLSSPLIIRYSADLNICKTLCFSLIKLSYKSLSQHLECKISESAFIEIFCMRNWQLQIYLLLPSELFSLTCLMHWSDSILQPNFAASSDRQSLKWTVLFESKVWCLRWHEKWKTHNLIHQRWHL